MMSAAIIIVLCLALAIAAILLSRRSRTTESELHDIAAAFVDNLPAKHSRFFPVIQQALSDSDAAFLKSRVPRGPRRRALAARRKAALYFLTGLRADYLKLMDLSRLLSKIAPESAHESETERIKLEWRFNFIYAVVWFQLRTGALPLAQLGSLSDTIGALAARLEVAVNAWQETSLLQRLE